MRRGVHRRSRLAARLVVCAAVALALASDLRPAHAQEPPRRPTLPPVVVEPPALPEQVPATGEGTLPPVVVEPETPPAAPTTAAASDRTLAFPSLADQDFEGLTGGLRSPGSLFDQSRSVTFVGPELLREIAPQDVGEALELQPGVSVQRTGRGQASPFVRGLTGQQVLILVDGIRLTNATFRAGPNQYFNLVDPNTIERIEVVRGPASAVWGADAIGGVINIVTREPEFTGWNYITGGTVQRFSTADSGYQGRLDVEGWIGASGVLAGAGYGNYHDVDRGGDLGRQPATGYNSVSGDVKFTRTIDRFSRLVVALQHFEQNDLLRTDVFERGDVRQFDPQARSLAYARWEGTSVAPWCDRYAFTVSYQRMKEDQVRQDAPGDAFTRTSAREFTDDIFGLNLLLATDLDRAGRLTYGFDWYHEDVDSSRVDTDFTTTPATVTQRDGPFPDDGYYSRYGLFLQWDVALTERLDAVAGLRYSWIETGATVTAGGASGLINPTYSDVSTNVGLVYELAPNWRLVGSYAEGFRPPNLDDLAATNDDTFAGTQIPDPTLRPERSRTWEVGLKSNTDRFRSQAFVWWTRIDDHILRQPVGDPLDPGFLLVRENRDTELQGVDLAAEWLADDGWSLYGNFSYVFGRDLTEVEPLSRIPPTQGVLGLRRRDAGGNNWFDAYVWMVDRQDRLSARDLADTLRIPADGTPGFATLNFRYGRMLDAHQRLTLKLTNVTDKAYRVHGSGADGPGISLLIGYEWLP